MKIERLSPDELSELARDVAMDRVFITNSDEGIRCSFGGLLAMLPPGTIERDDLELVGALYERFDKAGPRSINGYPFFFSARFLHRDDLEPLMQLIDEKRRVLESL